MIVSELAKNIGAEIVCGTEALLREVTCAYACDLLSLVMGRGPQDSAWMTVMGNVNAVAVAALADISCIILCEGVLPDEETIKKATMQDIAVLTINAPIYETCISISKLI